MKISDEAKTMLEEAFVSNDCNCLKAMLQKSCCGESTVFNLAQLENSDEPTTINPSFPCEL